MSQTPLTDVPTLDSLLADPGKIATLPPITAQALLIGLGCLQPLLIQRALLWPQNGREETIKKNALTAKQVAAILNVKPSFVYEMARQKQLKSYKVGKYLRFKEAAVNDYLAKRGA
jgi:excisionase family DNA binding protein